MTKALLMTAAAALVTLAGVADAEAGSRSGSFTGPRGTTTWQSERSCSGGTCTRSGSVTGPAGNTRSREGSATCQGGSCAYSGSVTGPRGTGTYSGTVTRGW